MAAAVRRIARMRGMAAEPAAATDTDADAAPEPAPKSRSDMFPAIEEINFIRYRDYLFVFIALIVGLITRIVSFYLFDRGIVRRVDRLTKSVSEINSGTRLSIPPPKKDDAIGLLEQEIVKIAEQRELLDDSNK